MRDYVQSGSYPGTRAASHALALRWAAVAGVLALVVLGLAACYGMRGGFLTPPPQETLPAARITSPPTPAPTSAPTATPSATPSPTPDPTAEPTQSPSAVPTVPAGSRVALTFDDGPKRGATEAMLDMLARKGVQGTFFIIGQHVPGNEAILQRAVEEGHLLGNHTMNHRDLAKLADEEILSQILPVNEIIQAAGGTPRYVRPPLGSTSARYHALLRELGLTTVMWSVDTRDWSLKDPQAEVELALSQVRGGGVILFHDIYPASVEAAEMLIDRLRELGYEIVRLDELLGE